MSCNNTDKKYAIALGYFDGLHIAHRAVINEAVRYSDYGFIPAVLLFDAHPRSVLNNENVSFLLQKDKRDSMLNSLGVVPLYVAFDEIKDMSPEEFVREVLIGRLNAGAVCCGFNYRFGKNGSGDPSELERLAGDYKLMLTVCPPVSAGGQEVSSTAIRNAIKEGNAEKAAEMLGYPFMFSSEVFTGDRRGRLLGAPTINQFLPEGIAVPRFGVYASKVYFDNKEYTGVTNIGSRPTFDGGSVRSETFILDFNGDLYGREVEVHLYSFIRPECRFPDALSLQEQIAKDVEAARIYFLEKNEKK